VAGIPPTKFERDRVFGWTVGFALRSVAFFLIFYGLTWLWDAARLGEVESWDHVNAVFLFTAAIILPVFYAFSFIGEWRRRRHSGDRTDDS
jgi:heme/copper-type cytochrome/quinol oxidase subunit 2